MEPWKIGVIIALIVGIGGYRYYEINAPVPPPPPVPTPRPEDIQTEGDFKKLVGQPAPAWSIEPKLWTNTPKPINLGDLKGNVTLLEFWRTGCPHCRDAAPYMEKVFETYKPKGLKIVTFHAPGKHADASNPELSWPSVQSDIRAWGIKYPVAYDTDSKLFRGKYKGYSYPSLFLLDRHGVIRYALPGSPTHTLEREAEFLKALHETLGIPPWNSPQLLSGRLVPSNMPNPAAAHGPGDGHGHGLVDGHGPGDGHNHAPMEGHGPGDGHNHGPAEGHGPGDGHGH